MRNWGSRRLWLFQSHFSRAGIRTWSVLPPERVEDEASFLCGAMVHCVDDLMFLGSAGPLRLLASTCPLGPMRCRLCRLLSHARATCLFCEYLCCPLLLTQFLSKLCGDQTSISFFREFPSCLTYRILWSLASHNPDEVLCYLLPLPLALIIFPSLLPFPPLWPLCVSAIFPVPGGPSLGSELVRRGTWYEPNQRYVMWSVQSYLSAFFWWAWSQRGHY